MTLLHATQSRQQFNKGSCVTHALKIDSWPTCTRATASVTSRDIGVWRVYTCCLSSVLFTFAKCTSYCVCHVTRILCYDWLRSIHTDPHRPPRRPIRVIMFFCAQFHSDPYRPPYTYLRQQFPNLINKTRVVINKLAQMTGVRGAPGPYYYIKIKGGKHCGQIEKQINNTSG